MATTLTLGAYTFTNFTVPERINGGGSQSLPVKQLVGGARVINSMGSMPDDIYWTGLFFGEDAEITMKSLDALRTAGLPMNLNYSLSFYLVMIKDFTYLWEREYQIKYRITVTVLEDLTNPISDASSISYNDAINQLLNTSGTLSGSINNANISNSASSVNSSFATIPSVEDASSAQIGSLSATVQNAQNVTISESSALNTATFSNPISSDQMSANLATLSDMYILQNVQQKILLNLSFIITGATGRHVIVNGGSLYRIAATYYQDALKWTTIAMANGLSDPQLPSGVPMDIVIPVISKDTGGVLNP